MPEYIFTNLPQYVKLNSRTEFSSSVVSSGAVLLFTEDGLTLTGKLPDGTFITIGGSSGTDPVGNATASDILAGKSATVSGGSVISGAIPTVSATSSGSQITVPAGYIATSQNFTVTSGGVEVTLGYITSGGLFQPLAFEGTMAFDNGSAIALSCFTWNLPGPPSSDRIVISSGVYSSGITVNQGQGLVISSGGTAVDITENGGWVFDWPGAVATFASNTFSGLTVSSNQFITVHSGTTANNTTVGISGAEYEVFTGGGLAVLSGGIANDTTVYLRGYMNVNSGATANSINLNSGKLNLNENGVVNGVVINGGSMLIKSGATANGITFNSGDWTIFSGGTINSAIINAGAGLSAGVTANHTTVNSGGFLTIHGAALASNTTVSSGGTMFIFTGAVTSNITSETGAVIINS